MKDTTDALVTFIQDEIVVDDTVISGDTDLLLGGAVDSLGVIRITHWMEETAGITVDPGDVTLDNFQTVDKMISFLSSRTGV